MTTLKQDDFALGSSYFPIGLAYSGIVAVFFYIPPPSSNKKDEDIMKRVLEEYSKIQIKGVNLGIMKFPDVSGGFQAVANSPYNPYNYLASFILQNQYMPFIIVYRSGFPGPTLIFSDNDVHNINMKDVQQFLSQYATSAGDFGIYVAINTSKKKKEEKKQEEDSNIVCKYPFKDLPI